MEFSGLRTLLPKFKTIVRLILEVLEDENETMGVDMGSLNFHFVKRLVSFDDKMQMRDGAEFRVFSSGEDVRYKFCSIAG